MQWFLVCERHVAAHGDLNRLFQEEPARALARHSNAADTPTIRLSRQYTVLFEQVSRRTEEPTFPVLRRTARTTDVLDERRCGAS